MHSVERNPQIIQYYLRQGSYRGKVKYLGKIRPIDTVVIHSLQHVSKILKSKLKELDLNKILSYEVLVQAGDYQLWRPIQNRIIAAFKEEVKIGRKITVYCAFFNEHTSKKKLYNTFLLSEFIVL